MKHLIFSILMLVYSQATLACRELNWSPAEYAYKSEEVYIALVQSVSLNKQVSEKEINIEKYRNSIRAHGDINVTLKVVESLKGEELKELKISLNWCRGGQYELGDLVVAYKFGKYWHVKNTKPAIVQAINALKPPI